MRTGEPGGRFHCRAPWRRCTALIASCLAVVLCGSCGVSATLSLDRDQIAARADQICSQAVRGETVFFTPLTEGDLKTNLSSFGAILATTSSELEGLSPPRGIADDYGRLVADVSTMSVLVHKADEAIGSTGLEKLLAVSSTEASLLAIRVRDLSAALGLPQCARLTTPTPANAI